MLGVPAVADRNDGEQNRHEDDERAVVGERPREDAGTGRWPCLDRVGPGR